jgi:hypothetical protein
VACYQERGHSLTRSLNKEDRYLSSDGWECTTQ